MDAVGIMKQMNECMQSDMSEQKKYINRVIFKAAIQKSNGEQSYNYFLDEYKKYGKRLEELTDGQFKLDSNIIITEDHLRKYLINSEVGVYLNNKNKKYCTFEELFAECNTLAKLNPSFNPNCIKIAISLYQVLEKIGIMEKHKIETISITLSNLFGENLLSDSDKVIVVSKTGLGKIKSIERTNDQFSNNKMQIIKILEGLKKDITDTAYSYLIDMIDEIFDYYLNGNKEIDLTEQLIKQV